jgi:hypothetical protein
MAAAKQSALDTLHRLYVATLTLQLQAGEPTAAMLATIGSFLSKSGVKSVDDSPTMRNLARAYESLTFTTADTPTTNDTSEKVSH